MFTTAFVTAKVYDVNRLIGEGGVQGLAWGQTPFATWFFFCKKKKKMCSGPDRITDWVAPCPTSLVYLAASVYEKLI